MNTHNNAATLQKALGAHQQGNLVLARKLYQELLNSEPNNFDCLHMLGVICLEDNELDDAIKFLKSAASVNGNDAGVFNNLGLVMHEKKSFDEALCHFDKAIILNAQYAEAFSNKALALNALGKSEEAVHALNNAIALAPEHAYFHNNLGLVYADLGRRQLALDCYSTAIKLSASYANAFFNRGNVFASIESYQLAINDYDAALSFDPKNAAIHFNRANSLMYLGQFTAAENGYQRAIDLDNTLPYLLGARLHNRMHYCNWTNYETELEKIAKGIESNKRVIAPFALISLTDKADLHFRVANIWNDDKCQLRSAPYPNQSAGTPKSRMKIAYFSADFHNHATAQLIAGVLEQHNRDRFEIIAYSFGPNLNDKFRQRIISAVEIFYEISSFNDLQIIEHARSQNIDIAIDLKGYTQHSRPQIFANRVAPVQINYLGYPGTLAMPNMDYMLVDPIILGDGDDQLIRGEATEKILTLPNCYQPNDRIPENLPTYPINRSTVGLPADAFVFCCFNSAHKILPDVFRVWAQILKRVPGSVLWLLGQDIGLQKNLKREARRLGVSPERIVFAPKLELEQHLARLALADLFLDTFPYNAHTTASDALRAGVPIITMKGRSFPSRVAASLLSTLGINDLITENSADYIELAVTLALDSDRLRYIKSKLLREKLNEILFNPNNFALHLEKIYEQLIQKNSDHLD